MPLYEGEQRLRERLGLLTKAAVVMFGLLGVLFWYIQIIKFSIYDYKADINAVRTKPLVPERGLILDRDGRPLAKNRPSFKLLLRKNPDRRSDPAAVFKAVEAWVPLDEEFARRNMARSWSGADPEPALIVEDLTVEELARVEARLVELPDLEVEESLARYCPGGGIGAHVLGYVGQASQEQLDKGVYKRCTPRDIVGKAGIELRYDEQLRGRPGWKKVYVNHQGREIRDTELEPKLPVKGNDIVLTIDDDLMRAAQLAMVGQNGAVVALDPRNGEVLVMLSSPAFDPNLFYSKSSRNQWKALSQRADHPLFNRAIQGPAAPGSVFKLIMATGGLETGVVTPQRTTSCGGRTVIYGDTFSCWRPGGHGTVELYRAITQSCNVYFYHVAEDLGIEPIAKYAKMFALGRRSGIDLGPENSGLIPDPDWKEKRFNQPWYKGETISVGIGQGAVGVTPLQVADMTAGFANRGKIYKPRLLRRVVGVRERESFETRRELLAEVAVSAGTFETVRHGMWGVVNDAGTGGKCRSADYVAAGKTGTAQVASESVEGARKHAWFTAFAPFEEPELVVTVFVEFGGHGGETAAPVAKAVFDAYFKKYHGIGAGPLLAASLDPGGSATSAAADDATREGGDTAGTSRVAAPATGPSDGARPGRAPSATAPRDPTASGSAVSGLAGPRIGTPQDARPVSTSTLAPVAPALDGRAVHRDASSVPLSAEPGRDSSVDSHAEALDAAGGEGEIPRTGRSENNDASGPPPTE